ncbi:MAG: MgtC/SapB family protein [Candidatus Omnitrophica bacterium]|nr:MgtC/SapB family protein [Candidatus Omnitrophota bacterium]
MNLQELVYPLSWAGIGIAILCGLIVGLERQLSGKPTGIRTSALICLGAYAFVAIGSLITENQDITRIVAQIITGIGFIGAGVILSREGIVIGVTSAAVIWVLAGIGILIGFEKYTLAVLLSLITVGILVGVNVLEKIFKSLRQGVYKKFSKKKQRDREGE